MKNGKTRLRLAEACKKVKLNLSMGRTAGISIDCLMDGEDMEDSISREDFEALIQPLITRLIGLVRTVTDSVAT